MNSIYVRSALGVLLASTVAASASPPLPQPLSQMSKAEKKQEQAYFRKNSMNFSEIFKRYHPGPYWILHHEAAFHLTADQKKEEESLKTSMAKRTIADNMALRRAYEQYSEDAAASDVQNSVIEKDIDRVGRAATTLAKEMVPYHIKAYSILTAEQKTIYKSLAAKTDHAKSDHH